MKKYASSFVGAVAIVATVLFSAWANAQAPQSDQRAPMGMPGVPELSEEYKADLNRELQPRGEKIGLLIVSHGAGTKSWSDLVAEITEKVRALDAKDHVFAAIDWCNMEFDHVNDIVAGFGRLEKAGCDAVVVVPAFIYPTSHVQFDVATILGIYGDARAREAAREENARILRTKLPIALAPTLSAGDLLKDYVVDQVKSVSKDPSKERVLIVAHGDDDYAGLVDSQTKSAVDGAASLGFDSVETAYVGMGFDFPTRAKPIIEKNTKEGKKTIVVAIYLASASKSFLERVQKFPSMGPKDENAPNPSLEGLDYVGTETSLGKFEETPKYIYEVAVEASKN